MQREKSMQKEKRKKELKQSDARMQTFMLIQSYIIKRV